MKDGRHLVDNGGDASRTLLGTSRGQKCPPDWVTFHGQNEVDVKYYSPVVAEGKTFILVFCVL